MNRLFSPNGPVMQALGKMADLLILSLLWILCSIPLITVGPATSALYYICLKLARKEDTNIVKPFFHAFKDNLLQGMAQTLIFCIGAVCFMLNYRLIFYAEGAFRIIMQIVYILLLVCCISTVIYTFALQAQFRNKLTATIRNAFFLSLSRPLHSLSVLIVHGLPVLALFIAPSIFMRLIPLVICLVPAGIARFCAKGFALIFNPLVEESLVAEGKQPESTDLLPE